MDAGASTSSGLGRTHVVQAPRDPTFLYLQPKHRSHYIFTDETGKGEKVDVHRADSGLWPAWAIESEHSPRTVQCMEDMGFGLYFRVGHLQYDHALIAAFLERYRPETHTFHLPFGEVMISLEDVEVLTGLRVDGHPLHPALDLPMGPVAQGNYLRGALGLDHIQCPGNAKMHPYMRTTQKVLLEPIKARLRRDIPYGAGDDEFRQRARCFALWAMGGCWFSDSTKCSVPMECVRWTDDYGACSQLSWGSAVLAYLYRQLCKAAIADAGKITSIGGALNLFHMWARERIRRLQPTFIPGPSPGFPLGYRWSTARGYEEVPSHIVSVYRDMLSSMTAADFIWRPYAELLPLLPVRCIRGQHIWCSTTTLLFRDIVECHLPRRCARQFGFYQTIPDGTYIFSDTRSYNAFHKAPSNVDRGHWINRAENIFVGDHAPDVITPDPAYLQWYCSITVRFMTNPEIREDSGHVGLADPYTVMAQNMATVHRLVARRLGELGEDADEFIHTLFDITRRSLENPHVVVHPDPVVPYGDDPGSTRRQRVVRHSSHVGHQPGSGRQPRPQPPLYPPQPPPQQPPLYQQPHHQQPHQQHVPGPLYGYEFSDLNDDISTTLSPGFWNM